MLKGYGRAGTAVEVLALGFAKWFMEQEDIAQNDLIYLKVRSVKRGLCERSSWDDESTKDPGRLVVCLTILLYTCIHAQVMGLDRIGQVDIEGAECSVLDAWMDAGLTCLVQEYFVEWHDVFTPEVKECATRTRGRLRDLAKECDHEVQVHVW
jgi:hypothetical protein